MSKGKNVDLSYSFVKPTTSSRGKSHGTRCAGVIAGKRSGGTCRNGGIAYNAQLADIQIMNGTLAHDSVTAKALGYKRQEIDIYSNSWGPSDNGHLVNGPGPLVKEALMEGAKWGRGGLGSIFVFSTGNGGRFQDSCAFDGYVNSIYTIAIGAVTKLRKTPYYAEPCSSVMAAAYGDDVKTCDVTGCVSNFGRTSAAAAMASGIIALLLEATKNTLTWRDVHHLIVRTSRPNRDVSGGKDWIVNGAGLMVHPFLGFGIMNANKLVKVATKSWKKVPHQKSCAINVTERKFNSNRNSFVIDTNQNEGCSKIHHIEQVQVEISISIERRGLLQMYLESPHKTKSKLIYERMYDALTGRGTFNNLPVTSLHFWGENVQAIDGKWKISFESSLNSFRNRRTEGKLSMLKITFYGTEEDPVRNSGLTKGFTTCEYGNGFANFSAIYGGKCCGTLGVYDERRAKCCNGQKIVQKDSVCGGRKYDQCTQICCDGKIHKKNEGTTCCGQQTYKIKTQICCKNSPVAKFKCQRVWYRGGFRSYLRYEEAVCHPYYKLYYYPKYGESCPDPCTDHPCKNGGRCLGNIEKYTFACRCSQGYEGQKCERKVEIRREQKACKDEDNNCEFWKSIGYCSDNGSKHWCSKTCGHCR